MAVKIKLKRMGKIRSPHYRIIIADSRTRRDGRAIEEIGLYNPMVEPSLIKVNTERVQYWLGVGAQPTEPVMAILKVTGDWQTFKGLPGGEGTLKVAEAKAEKRAAFDAALAEVHGEPKGDATTAKKKAAKKSTTKPDDAKSDDAKSDDTKPDDTKPDEAKSGSKSRGKAVEAKKDAPKKDTAKKDAPKKDAKAQDVKPVDVKSEDVKSEDVKSEDVKSEDAKSGGNAAEAKESDAKSDDAKADDAKADDAKADDAKPAEQAAEPTSDEA